MSEVAAQLDDWTFGEIVGRGAFSIVVKAIHKTSHEVLACKIITRATLADGGDRIRLQREINAMAFIRHPNLISLYDFFSDDHKFYLFMDYCPGGQLYDFIVKNEKLAEPLAAYLFCQIATGVAHLHAFGVAHRDLKPENILIGRSNQVKVSDFGLCGLVSPDQGMRTFCGSPCYCASECLNLKEYDGRLSDVWSLGVILFAMVTGAHPWNVTNPTLMLTQIMRGTYTCPPHVSPKCRALIQGMLKPNPDARFTMEQVLTHPWIDCAKKCKYSFGEPPVKGLPPLQTRSLEDLSAEAAKMGVPSPDGIVSPFYNGKPNRLAKTKSDTSGMLARTGVQCIRPTRSAALLSTGRLSARKVP
jgi:serine/threonine protein kinase